MQRLIALIALISIMILPLAAVAGPGNGKAPGMDSIYDIAEDDGRFTILLSLVDFAELDDTLKFEGQYTVFAPTDDAFLALIAALNSLLGVDETNALLSDQQFISDVLLYHVTDGRRFANSLINKNNPKPVDMLNGDYIFTNPDQTIADGSIVTSDALIENPNINASNGVIHVIDAVLLPPDN